MREPKPMKRTLKTRRVALCHRFVTAVTLRERYARRPCCFAAGRRRSRTVTHNHALNVPHQQPLSPQQTNLCPRYSTGSEVTSETEAQQRFSRRLLQPEAAVNSDFLRPSSFLTSRLLQTHAARFSSSKIDSHSLEAPIQSRMMQGRQGLGRIRGI